MLREYMTGAFGAAYGTELTRPDFVALAEAFGIPARSTTPEKLQRDLADALAPPGPSVGVLPPVLRDGPWLDRVAAIAGSAGVAILYGFPERDGDEVFNAAQLVDRDGTVLAKHRKSHLFGDLDPRTFTPGAGDLAVVDLEGARVGILICYDVEFPEAVRSLALAGADLVAVPTALMRPHEVVARTVVPARAYENQVYVAYANRSGHEADLAYCGESCVVGPDGADLARAGSGEELLLAEIDPARLASSRAVNTHLRDR